MISVNDFIILYNFCVFNLGRDTSLQSCRMPRTRRRRISDRPQLVLTGRSREFAEDDVSWRAGGTAASYLWIWTFIPSLIPGCGGGQTNLHSVCSHSLHPMPRRHPQIQPFSCFKKMRRGQLRGKPKPEQMEYILLLVLLLFQTIIAYGIGDNEGHE